MYAPHRYASAFCGLTFLFSFNGFTQVGIGTTMPNVNAVLDVTSTPAATGGLLLPRVALTGTANESPLGAHVQGMTVYNTNTVGDVTPGYYYDDGTKWVRIATTALASDGWAITGNTGTKPNVNFLGTIDIQPLKIKTGNVERFDFTTNGRLRSYNSGSAEEPTYSWDSSNGQNMGMFKVLPGIIGFSTGGQERLRIPNDNQIQATRRGSNLVPFYSFYDDPDTGIYCSGLNQLGFATNGIERFKVPNAFQVHAASNGTAALPFYSWSADTNMGIYRIGTDVLGFSTTAIERMRITDLGKIGIGVNPRAKLDIVSDIDTEDVLYAEFASGLNSSKAAGNFYNRSNVTASSGVIGKGFYGVYGETTALGTGYGGYFIGDVHTTGAYSLVSDKRFKTNIVELSAEKSMLKKVMQLSAKSYNWRAEEFPGMAFDPKKKSFGFIAQELKEIFPELVDSSSIPDPKVKRGPRDEIKSASGYYSINYTGLIPILTEAIQEQQRIINSQEERISKLESLVQELLVKR